VSRLIMPHADKRRNLLKLAGAGSLLAATNGLWPDALHAQGSAQTATPKRGGRLRVAASNSSLSETLDPARGNNSGDYMRQFMFYSGLTELSATMQTEPALAESFETRDGLTWVFRLRRGVTFHNGKAFSAQDVVFSLTRHKDPQTASVVKVLADQIDTVRAMDSHTVEVVLTSPNSDLPAIFTTSHFLIVPDGTTDFSKGIGTGPYRCQEFTPGRRVVGVRNENFWKPGKPYLDEVELIGLTDAAARVNGLLAGDLHIASGVTANVTRLQQSAKHAVLETQSGLYTDVVVRVDMSPGNNADFVAALRYLQPRERLVKSVMRGFGTVANDHPVPPWHPYYLADLPQRPYDLDRARFHVQRGKLQGVAADLVCPSASLDGAVEGAQLLQQGGNQVGLKLNVRRVPYDGYWSQHWMKHPVSYGSVNPRPTLDMLFSQFYQSGARWNESGWKNEQFDQLLVAARGETNEARRKQMYGDMQTLIAEHCGTIVPAFISFLDGYDRRVQGLAPNPMGMLMGYRFAEHVWLDS